MSIDKHDVILAFQEHLKEELQAVESVAAMARDEVTSEETQQEGKYDTRATEASYLARGQAERIVALRQLLSWFEADNVTAAPMTTVQLRALVVLDGRPPAVVFVAPVGGVRVVVGGTPVQAISLTSPLGEAIDELEVGDDVEIHTPRGVRELTITSIV